MLRHLSLIPLLVLPFLAAASTGCCPRPTITPDDPVTIPVVMPVDAPEEAEAIEEVLTAFVAAVAGTSFDEAYAKLSGRHRARYSVETLQRDHESAGSEAGALIDRLRAALSSGAEPLVEGELATYPLGGGLSIGLVKEEGRWRIDRLR